MDWPNKASSSCSVLGWMRCKWLYSTLYVFFELHHPNGVTRFFFGQTSTHKDCHVHSTHPLCSSGQVSALCTESYLNESLTNFAGRTPTRTAVRTVCSECGAFHRWTET